MRNRELKWPWLMLALGAVVLAGCKPKDATNSAPAPEQPAGIVTSSGVEMVSLPGGTFSMGYGDGNPEERPAHSVTLTSFLIDKYPVTHDLMVKVQLPDGSKWQENPKTPVEQIRWRDAKLYCNERSRLEGLKPCYNEKTVEWDCDYSADGYRLPTEAEWEYAARAGNAGPYDCGSVDKLRQYGWFAENSEQMTHPVGQKKPNAWGIYEMYGNVSQWCEDVYDAEYYAHSASTDPTGPPSPGKDVKRVLRGGNWKTGADAARATFRHGERTGNTDACFSTSYCGFRCVRRATPDQLAKMKK